MNTNDIFAQAAREEMAFIDELEAKRKGRHDLSYELDDEVLRCDDCGMNALSARDFPTCEEYTIHNNEKNRRLRELAGL